MIKYTKSNVADRPTFRTEKFSNLLSDTWQGEVDQSDTGKWNAWLFNWSNSTRDEYKFGFNTKQGAIRWLNSQLRELGIK